MHFWVILKKRHCTNILIHFILLYYITYYMGLWTERHATWAWLLSALECSLVLTKTLCWPCATMICWVPSAIRPLHDVSSIPNQIWYGQRSNFCLIATIIVLIILKWLIIIGLVNESWYFQNRRERRAEAVCGFSSFAQRSRFLFAFSSMRCFFLSSPDERRSTSWTVWYAFSDSYSKFCFKISIKFFKFLGYSAFLRFSLYGNKITEKKFLQVTNTCKVQWIIVSLQGNCK